MTKHFPRFLSSKAQAKADMIRRLEACLEIPGNGTCADCSEPNPKWASLLVTTSLSGKRKKKMGVFCCYKCCSYHFQLGRDVCEVKNIKIADDWTDEEVKAMERSGNDFVNHVYESDRASKRRAELEGMKGDEEQQARAKFVQDKYKHKKFISKQAGQIQESDDEDDNRRSSSAASPKSATPDTSNGNKSGINYGSNNFFDRLMEKSTAGITPKSATGRAAQEHLSESFRAEETANLICPEDLGYGTVDPKEDLGYEDVNREAEVAQKLANQALVRTGSRRRLSISTRNSIGPSAARRRSNSRGSLGGGADRETNNRRKRSSLGFLNTDEDEEREQDMFLPATDKNVKRRSSWGSLTATQSITTVSSAEKEDPKRRTGRRGSLGARRVETTSTLPSRKVTAESPGAGRSKRYQSGKRGSLGRNHSADSKAEERHKRRSGRRGSLSRQGSSGSIDGDEKPRRRSDRRGSLGRQSSSGSIMEAEQNKPNRRSDRRGSLGQQQPKSASNESEQKPKRRSDRRGSLGRQQSSGDLEGEQKPKRRSGRRGSMGRCSSFDEEKPNQGCDAARRRSIGRQGSEKALESKQPRPTDGEGNRRRRGSIGAATKKSADPKLEPRPRRRTSIGATSSHKSKSPETKEHPKRSRRRCSMGGPSDGHPSAAVTCQ